MNKLIKWSLAFAAFVSFNAHAGVVTFNNITGSWLDINPSSITATGNGTSTPSMRWGGDAGSGQSGYDFDAATTPFGVTLPPSPSSTFDLGTFTHLNNPIYPPSLESVTLEVVADIDVDGTDIGTRTFMFDFLHNETPNNADPCANGDPNGNGVNGNGCADIVTVGFNSLSETFNVDGDFYTLEIIGFNGPLGFVTGFETVERQDNTATLIAQLRLEQVNEPATVFLLGIGLLGLGLARRRHVN